ncbi:unnamed protein product [Candidula unifasciata]|uniref:Methyltransferase FkbM domain-containing protein n=1 Tax=Candidula unifasciata TaxID=100452 RepID=A0A8S3YIU5_9EUPU|nr:unnamed protein product [Candidula unifasciata]
MNLMKIRRMLNSYGLYVSKRAESTFLFLVLIVVIVTILLSWQMHGIRPRALCMSDVNLKSQSLNRSGIHVIPSVPEKRSWFENLEKEEEDLFNPYLSECVDVKAPGDLGTLLTCIHDAKKDLMVSAHLKNKGGWEPENVEAMYEMHKRFPGLVLVDLGCNIGVFTLPAAKMGMEVVAVDSMLSSLQLLQRSLFINGLSCHVTLIHNALYRKQMQMRVALDPSNVGASKVVEILEFRRHKIHPSQLVDAVCLDDLMPLVKGKTVFLKVDLENNERALLECADQFFKYVNVKVLLIEWMYYRHNEKDSRFIKNFLLKHHMVPTWGIDIDREIDVSASSNWPDNVFWMKRG